MTQAPTGSASPSQPPPAGGLVGKPRSKHQQGSPGSQQSNVGQAGPQHGSLESWLPDLLRSGNPDHNRAIYAYLSPTDLPRLERRLNRLTKLRAMKFRGPNAPKKRGRAARAVGKQFEHLIHGILQDSVALRYLRNVNTTTAEIDFIIGVEPMGFRFVPMLHESGNHLVGEAKCYASAPKSEWINEFCGVLRTHGAKTGILFVSCTSRTLASAVRQNIALHSAMGHRIVPFGLRQLEQVRGGRSFLEVLVEQYTLAAAHGPLLV